MKPVTTSLVLLFLLIGTSLNAQSWWNRQRVKGNGQVTSEERTLDGFERISACCNFEVLLTEGDFYLRVEAESNLMEYIKTEVVGNELSIGWTKYLSVNTREPVRVYVTLPKLRGLDISSSSKVTGRSTFHGEALELEASSAGSIDLTFEGGQVEARSSSGSRVHLTGSATELRADASSGGSIRASDLPVAQGRAEASSGARVELTVSERLRADASSGGSIRYGGDPTEMDTDASSGGSVRKQ